MPPDFRIHVEAGHVMKVKDMGFSIGIYVTDDGQPTVVINTEEMEPEYRYDEHTGLPGTAEPYTVNLEGGDGIVVGPTGDIVSRHYEDNSVSARLAAFAHCNALNDNWANKCGMPDIQVLLNDGTIYDSEDHNPDLRERRARARQEV